MTDTTGTAGAPLPKTGSEKTRVVLTVLTPSFGGGNIHRRGNNLTMPCASGESDDRLRTVEYNLLGRYSILQATLRVTRARDIDTALQISIFADGREVADSTLTMRAPSQLNVPVAGRQEMKIQLVCQFPDSEIAFENPMLVHL
jgi:hypothetical protein